MLTVKKQRDFAVRRGLMNHLCLNRTGEIHSGPGHMRRLFVQSALLSYITENYRVITWEDGLDDWELQVGTSTYT